MAFGHGSQYLYAHNMTRVDAIIYSGFIITEGTFAVHMRYDNLSIMVINFVMFFRAIKEQQDWYIDGIAFAFSFSLQNVRLPIKMHCLVRIRS